MFIHRCLVVAVAVLGVSASAQPSHIVNYTIDAGGLNDQPLNGLSASAEFSMLGTQLTITLSNTSTGVPGGAMTADSLLVSLAFELLDGITIVSGDSAAIGAGSQGLGQWDGQGAGFDLGFEWAWTNDGGGDLLELFPQVITTSQGAGGGPTISFQGVPDPNVDGPFGGIAASPPILAIPGTQYAVSDSIEFNLTLSGTLSESQLATIARESIVEFGSEVNGVYVGVGLRFAAGAPNPIEELA